jgi:N-acetylmuramic acid 6-phosphate etherase
MNFTKTTEQSSKYEHLEKMSVQELLANINQEDKFLMLLSKHFPNWKLVNQIVAKMKLGGRLFYIGAGTSGRLVGRVRMPSYFWCSFRLSKRNYCWWWHSDSKSSRKCGQRLSGLEGFTRTQNKCQWCRGRYRSIRDTPYVIGGLEACNKIIL